MIAPTLVITASYSRIRIFKDLNTYYPLPPLLQYLCQLNAIPYHGATKIDPVSVGRISKSMLHLCLATHNILQDRQDIRPGGFQNVYVQCVDINNVWLDIFCCHGIFVV